MINFRGIVIDENKVKDVNFEYKENGYETIVNVIITTTDRQKILLSDTSWRERDELCRALKIN